MFRAFPQQRTSLAEEVLTSVLGNVHVSGKAPPRLFETTGAALQPLPVMMASALLVQLVQVGIAAGGCRRQWRPHWLCACVN